MTNIDPDACPKYITLFKKYIFVMFMKTFFVCVPLIKRFIHVGCLKAFHLFERRDQRHQFVAYFQLFQLRD